MNKTAAGFEVLRGIGCLTMCPPARGDEDAGGDDLGTVANGAVVWDETGTIVWAGAERDLPASYAGGAESESESESGSGRVIRLWDAGGGWVSPGLVDCHTHLAFGGDRRDEFVQRCRGTSYAEIARQGGGIARTVAATRAASREELADRARLTLNAMTAQGVTTVECKSGYGLTLEDECKILEAYQLLRETMSPAPTLVSTLLAAHAIPPEYREDRSGYAALVRDAIIPRVAERGLAQFVDVFVETGAFTVEEAEGIVEAGRAWGLRARLHVDQLHDGGGAALAARVGAASADHLECVGADGIRALGRAARDFGTIGVLLPFAALSLRQNLPDARGFFDAGIPLAIATDYNPGSSTCHDLPMILGLACRMAFFTPAQALRAATVTPARSLGLSGIAGSIQPGARADLTLWNAENIEDLCYHVRAAPVRAVWIGGRLAFGSGSVTVSASGVGAKIERV